MVHVTPLDPDTAPTIVMFIRHGEKPSDHGAPRGINDDGEHDNHSLSVRGWMRAGALAGLMAHAPLPSHPEVHPPQRIVATKPSQTAKSRRELDTADPIARRLEVVVDSDLEHGSEAEVRENILSDSRATLVVWHHGTMGHLVRGFPIANADDVPHHWPDDRFDLIWVLTRDPGDSEFTFTSVDQRLLDGDVDSST